MSLAPTWTMGNFQRLVCGWSVKSFGKAKLWPEKLSEVWGVCSNREYDLKFHMTKILAYFTFSLKNEI